MPVQFTCDGCGLIKPINIRLKGNQDYCGDPECQRKRKRLWQKKKMAGDPRYRQKHQASQTRWLERRPAHRYQAEYRKTHPQYVENNRVQQRGRNRKRKKPAAIADTRRGELIVKMDASTVIKSGTYLLTRCTPKKIVKMDAYLVQLQFLQGDEQIVCVPSS
jgi:hypothetical protein